MFRELVLEWKQGRAAQALTELVGGEPVAPNRFSEWESGKKPIDRYALAAIALLHPSDPRGCLAWLRGVTDSMAGLPADYKPVEPSDGFQMVRAIPDPALHPPKRRGKAS